MRIIYLAGNHPSNKTWIKKIKSKFDLFSTGTTLYYDHWTSKNKFINFDAESNKLTKLIKNKTNYYVFAKSVGTILALKTIYEKTFNPQKAIFCGYPYLLTKRLNLPINNYLKSLSIPTTFIQNESDPACNHSKLQKTLKKYSPTNYQLIKNPDNNTHDYKDYKKLTP